MNRVYKRITLLSIKYGPSILALICSIKVFLYTYAPHTNIYDRIISSINLLLNVALIGVLYCEGKYFHYCWKHKSLCRVALWGCVFYFVIMISDPPLDEIRIVTIQYLIGTVCLTILYKNV